MPGFLDFSTAKPSLTPAQQWAASMQVRATQAIWDFFNVVKTTYSTLWSGKDANPTGPVERIAAFGTGAQSAFLAHAAAVDYLLTVLPQFSSTEAMVAEVSGWQIPDGWTITFNKDGSAIVTPPIGQ